jgi:predicted nucleotidyltransferase
MDCVSDLIRRRACDAVSFMAERADIRQAYLFGSHATGRADEFSDIDVALFIPGLAEWSLARSTRLIRDTQKRLGCDIEPHLYPAESLEHLQPASFTAYILKHGIPLDVNTTSVTQNA